MNPWDLALAILGWLVVVLLVVCAIFAVIIFAVGVVYGIGKAFNAKWTRR